MFLPTDVCIFEYRNVNEGYNITYILRNIYLHIIGQYFIYNSKTEKHFKHLERHNLETRQLP